MTNPPTSKGPETFAEAARRLLQRLDAGKIGCGQVLGSGIVPHLAANADERSKPKDRATVSAASPAITLRVFEQPQPQRLGEAGTKAPRLGLASPQARRLDLVADNDNRTSWVLAAGGAVFDAVDFAGDHVSRTADP